MSIMLQAMLFEKYGPRLDTTQLAGVLGIGKTTLYNQVSAGRCLVPTYVEGGQRYADVRDVAAHLDAMRALAT
jgi:hypothetical protein